MACFHRGRPINHVATVLKLSVLTNVLIVATMGVIAVAAHSLALLSALAENMVDLLVQSFLTYAGTRKAADKTKYPVGTARLEPAAVIVASSVMVFISALFVKEGVTKIVEGVMHDNPTKPELSVSAVVIVTLAISTKVFLMFYSRWVLKFNRSVAVQAIQDDNRNDIVSNAFAIIAYIIGSANEKLWYIDPAGAITVFLFILVAWGRTGKEQIVQLVGVTASGEFIDQVKGLTKDHHPQLSLDIVRAYHSGSNYIVELDVVVPAEMAVKEAHDIALQLQFKVEQLEEVERAYVHVDYQTRSYDEHDVSREPNALTVYAGVRSSVPKQSEYAVVPQNDPGPAKVVPVPNNMEIAAATSGTRHAWSYRESPRVHCDQ